MFFNSQAVIGNKYYQRLGFAVLGWKTLSWAKTTLDDPTTSFYAGFFDGFFGRFVGRIFLMVDFFDQTKKAKMSI